ncbi:phage tail protein [Sphingomonas sp. ac-8]|uniref:phage tail protein n=1 Tax=Sphingomonas sp. ac-8 TaxID=3242977 RepID=UPI003A80EBA2
MRKPDSLRAAVTAALPDLARDPHALKIWLAKGHVKSNGVGTDARLEYGYELSLLLLDFTGDPDTLFAALVEWLAREQPNLLLRPTDASAVIPFEIDVLDDSKVDILVSLQLDEAIERNGDGFTHLPTPLLEESAPIAGLVGRIG